jgi:hypothetical protein
MCAAWAQNNSHFRWKLRRDFAQKSVYIYMYIYVYIYTVSINVSGDIPLRSCADDRSAPCLRRALNADMSCHELDNDHWITYYWITQHYPLVI